MFNIIIFVLDTLRLDHSHILKKELEKMGYFYFSNVIVPSNWTTPSHASLFTGLYPKEHNAYETGKIKNYQVKLNIENENILITKILKALGYDNYLITANMFINPMFGFKGFDFIFDTSTMPFLNIFNEDEIEYKNKIKKDIYKDKTLHLIKKYIEDKKYKLIYKTFLSNLITPIYKNFYRKYHHWPKDKGVKKTIKILNNIFKKESFKNYKFLFINLMEMHEPYLTKDYLCEKGLKENLKNNYFNKNLVNQWKTEYQNQMKYLSFNLLKYLHKFNETENYNNSLIIITSDHGQLLGEHNRIGHTSFLYDELTKVPLFIKFPNHITTKNIPVKSLISLKSLKYFIINLLKNQTIEFDSLINNTVFSECYGISINVDKPKNEYEADNIKKLDRYKCAIYHKNYKGIYDVSSNKFEFLKCYSENIKIKDEIKQNLKDKILKFIPK